MFFSLDPDPDHLIRPGFGDTSRSQVSSLGFTGGNRKKRACVSVLQDQQLGVKQETFTPRDLKLEQECEARPSDNGPSCFRNVEKTQSSLASVSQPHPAGAAGAAGLRSWW